MFNIFSGVSPLSSMSSLRYANRLRDARRHLGVVTFKVALKRVICRKQNDTRIVENVVVRNVVELLEVIRGKERV